MKIMVQPSGTTLCDEEYKTLASLLAKMGYTVTVRKEKEVGRGVTKKSCDFGGRKIMGNAKFAIGNDEFVQNAKSALVQYLTEKRNYDIDESNVYVVWLCKVLQNNKALLSTTVEDGMYYEVTYNGDKGEMYLDAYEKRENVCFKVWEELE